MVIRMAPTDKLLARSRGQLQEALDYLEQFDYGDDAYKAQVRQFINSLFKYTLAVGLDFAILLAESQEECFYQGLPWNNRWARERLNFANMGVTGDPTQDEASHVFKSGEEFARSFVAHILLYATGKIDRGGLTPADDVRYDAYIKEYGATVQATTIADLANKYAIDSNYADTICERANDVLWPKGLTYTMTTPAYATAPKLTYANGTSWDGKADIVWYGTIIYAQPRTVTAIAGGQARASGSSSGAPTRAPYTANEPFRVLGWFTAGDGTRYWVTDDHSRVPVEATIDKPITIAFA